MASEFELRVADIHGQARPLPPIDRSDYLDKTCGADAELRASVDALLARHDTDTVSQLLEAVSDGSPDAAQRLFERVYDQLRVMARAQMVHERHGHTLQPTALVHEAYQRLLAGENRQFVNRRYFFGAAGQAMQRILIDYAKKRKALKHGGDWKRVRMDAGRPAGERDLVERMAVAEALDELEAVDPRKAEVVRLRYFVGLSVEETANVLEVAPRTVNADWEYARSWLHGRLRSDDEGPVPGAVSGDTGT